MPLAGVSLAPRNVRSRAVSPRRRGEIGKSWVCTLNRNKPSQTLSPRPSIRRGSCRRSSRRSPSRASHGAQRTAAVDGTHSVRTGYRAARGDGTARSGILVRFQRTPSRNGPVRRERCHRRSPRRTGQTHRAARADRPRCACAPRRSADATNAARRPLRTGVSGAQNMFAHNSGAA